MLGDWNEGGGLVVDCTEGWRGREDWTVGGEQEDDCVDG